jgi:hypothetical protein
VGCEGRNRNSRPASWSLSCRENRGQVGPARLLPRSRPRPRPRPVRPSSAPRRHQRTRLAARRNRNRIAQRGSLSPSPLPPGTPEPSRFLHFCRDGSRRRAAPRRTEENGDGALVVPATCLHTSLSVAHRERRRSSNRPRSPASTRLVHASLGCPAAVVRASCCANQPGIVRPATERHKKDPRVFGDNRDKAHACPTRNPSNPLFSQMPVADRAAIDRHTRDCGTIPSRTSSNKSCRPAA